MALDQRKITSCGIVMNMLREGIRYIFFCKYLYLPGHNADFVTCLGWFLA
jgi:hypothetical protein